jgi:hypothetical protein
MACAPPTAPIIDARCLTHVSVEKIPIERRRTLRLGATDADLAKAFDVTTVTIWNWKAKHEEFF